MDTIIPFLLANFTLTFLVLGFAATGIAIAVGPKPINKSGVIEALFSYFLLFAIGFAYFYNFVCHVFFGEMAAEFIGWAQSPFQLEVGMASLGFSVVGFMAFKSSLGVRAAAVVGPGVFMLGAASGHVYQMIHAGNFAPGNAGVMFYSDIILPVIGLVLLGLQAKCVRIQLRLAKPIRTI